MKHKFFGYYFKHDFNNHSISFIIGKCSNHSFIQVIDNKKSFYFKYPLDSFYYRKEPFIIGIDDTYFTLKGGRININSQIKGVIKYTNPIIPKHHIMGPFKYSMIDCFHDVKSMRHEIKGKLKVDENIYNMSGLGYIEGDCGNSFPKDYLWLQAHFGSDASIFLANATVDVTHLPFCFDGLIAIFYHKQEQYFFTTYNLSSIKHSYVENTHLISLKNISNDTLNIIVKPANSVDLLAPINGNMCQSIKHTLQAHVTVYFQTNNETYSYFSSQAGFEHKTNQDD